MGFQIKAWKHPQSYDRGLYKEAPSYRECILLAQTEVYPSNSQPVAAQWRGHNKRGIFLICVKIKENTSHAL
ncbi:MAG: hypothetical protein LBO67_00535 [Spirochaetaceae bacterium]|nr:hypothetical protein [Spirochaetaceae bacterium]